VVMPDLSTGSDSSTPKVVTTGEALSAADVLQAYFEQQTGQVNATDIHDPILGDQPLDEKVYLKLVDEASKDGNDVALKLSKVVEAAKLFLPFPVQD